MKIKIALSFLLTLIITLIITFFSHVGFNDFLTIVGLIIAVSGLFFTLWQIWINIESNRDARLTREVDELKQEIHLMGASSAKHDFNHDQQIINLTADIRSLASQLEFHSTFLGNQVMRLRNESAEHGASIAGLSFTGELHLKLGKAERRIEDYERRLEELITIVSALKPDIQKLRT